MREESEKNYLLHPFLGVTAYLSLEEILLLSEGQVLDLALLRLKMEDAGRVFLKTYVSETRVTSSVKEKS